MPCGKSFCAAIACRLARLHDGPSGGRKAVRFALPALMRENFYKPYRKEGKAVKTPIEKWGARPKAADRFGRLRKLMVV